MNRTMKSSIVLVIALMVSLVTFTPAQSSPAQSNDTGEQKRGWAARAAEARAKRQAEGATRSERAEDTEPRTQTDPAEGSQDDSEAQNELFGWPQTRRPEPLVGAWLIDITTSNAGLPPFRALHTFHDGGTFTEVSDLLAQLGETPAHGVWNGKGSRYNLTFELFVFDPDKKPVGIIRVRVAIRLLSRDELVGDTVVDFIAPDGTIEKGIDSGPFTGKRIKVVPAN